MELVLVYFNLRVLTEVTVLLMLAVGTGFTYTATVLELFDGMGQIRSLAYNTKM